MKINIIIISCKHSNAEQDKWFYISSPDRRSSTQQQHLVVERSKLDLANNSLM